MADNSVNEHTATMKSACSTLQSLIGRLLDTGTVIVYAREEQVRCRVAQLQAFRRLVAERKLQLLALAEHRPQIVSGERLRLATGKREGWLSPTWRSQPILDNDRRWGEETLLGPNQR